MAEKTTLTQLEAKSLVNYFWTVQSNAPPGDLELFDFLPWRMANVLRAIGKLERIAGRSRGST